MLHRAIDIAAKSKYQKHKMGAIITDREGNILSAGYNVKGKTHPKQKLFADKAGIFSTYLLHAEIHAITLLPRTGRKPHSIYVARITRSGKIGMARPCPVCMLALKSAGITNIHYTTDGEENGRENIY